MKTDAAVTLDQAIELYEFLTASAIPKGMQIARGHQPRLTEKQAFTVIWFLQEHMGIIQDKYERCDVCGHLYNSEAEGRYQEKKQPHHACDYCASIS